MKILPHADDIVAVISHLLLDNKENSEKVFAVSVRIDVNDYESDTELPSVGAFVSLAVIPTSYRQVFCAFSERRKRFLECEWTLVSRHDSCWRDDGVRSTLKCAYSEVMREAELKFRREEKVLNVRVSIDNMVIADADKIFNPKLVNNTLSRPEFVFA